MWFRFLILVHFCAAFPLKCPEPAQWSIRARSHCPDPSKYFCLKNDLINGYSENCTIFDFLQPGRKNVLRGGLDADICSSERYQPWPIKFFTNISTNCIFRKSACQEEGQVVFDNGNRNTDVTCRCDYTRRYDFVVKPRNSCFCVPSEEDCSCYLKMCHVSTPEKYRTEVIVAIFVTSSLSVVIFVSFQIQIHIKSLEEINRNKHLVAIKDRTEIRRYVRIHVIGKEGVGKSSLVRRLVGDSDMKVNSTDGIDIVKTCQIKTTDGEWVIGKVETERKKIMKRIQETLNKEQKQSDSLSPPVISAEEETNEKKIISSDGSLSGIEKNIENHPTTVTIDKALTNENNVNIIDNSTTVAEQSSFDKPMKDNVVLSSSDIKKSGDSIKIEDMRKRIFEKMDEILVKVKIDQDKMTSESFVECGLWDYAGQKDYYATHQTFLNPHAIYLLITNISEDISATEDDKNFDSIEEYIDFWLDSIHCLRTSSPGHGLYPPVIVVCTHIDQYKKKKEVEDRKKEYIKRFKEVFGDQDKANHNRGIYFISNTECLKSDCKKLRDKISDVAKEMMFFAEKLPMQWIQLENALSVLKDDSKQNILSWRNFVELAQMLSINENELLPFLAYQHKIGSIIFFADIKEYIILKPDWLVKCFRCLVCDNHPIKRNIEIVQLTDWTNLEKTGQLSDNIIDRLFEKEPDLEFRKYKTHILNVMEKFDIIVKPQCTVTNNYSNLIQNSYYMPCMITTQSTSLDIIQKSFGSERSGFSSSPWLILEFKFLPLVYFNHILFYYITRYTVCEEKDGRKTLYRGKALVNLDKTGLRTLCICFSKNVIALQIWRLADVEYSRYDTILEELCRKIEELKRKLSQNISYDIKAKCRNGDYSNKQGRVTSKELDEICEQGRYYCREHKCTHSKDDVESTWLQYADIMKKEGESLGGGDLLNNCLSVQQQYTESAPQNHETQEKMIRGPVTGPATDLYSVWANYQSHQHAAASPAPSTMQQGSPMPSTNIDIDMEEEQFGTFNTTLLQNFNRRNIPMNMRTGMQPEMRPNMQTAPYQQGYETYPQSINQMPVGFAVGANYQSHQHAAASPAPSTMQQESPMPSKNINMEGKQRNIPMNMHTGMQPEMRPNMQTAPYQQGCETYQMPVGFADGENDQFNFRNNTFDPRMMTDMQATHRNYPGLAGTAQDFKNIYFAEESTPITLRYVATDRCISRMSATIYGDGTT